MSWDGTGSGANNPNQVDSSQRTGVIDEDGYDFIDEDQFPDLDTNDDMEATDEGDDE